MDPIQTAISENLKRIREERGLSLDQVSKLSGVSKSMLGQIERGVVSPTISTLWKISNGLKVYCTELMQRPELEVEIVEHSNLAPLLESDGKYRNYPVFGFSQERPFEMYYIEIDPGGKLEAERHPPGTQEFITVFSGRLELVAGGKAFTVNTGASIRFQADQPHQYQSGGEEICRLSMVISYT